MSIVSTGRAPEITRNASGSLPPSTVNFQFSVATVSIFE
jgi:hypothetical protein